MALVLKDRVKVNSTTAGTGTFTLGSAVNGFQGFSVIGDGNTTYYTITDYNGNWEVGYGTYTAAGTTLSRTTILESSNSGSVVDFPAGDKIVFVTYPAERSVITDGTTIQGNISGNSATATTATNQSGGTVAATTGSFSGSVTLSSGTANGVAYLNGSKVLTTGSALTFDGTNLGLGRTPTAKKLEVAGQIWSQDATQPTIYFGDTLSNYAYAAYKVSSKTAEFGADGASTQLVLKTVSAERMRIDSSGNVGIGTSSPSAKLNIAAGDGATAANQVNISGGRSLGAGVFGSAGSVLFTNSYWGAGYGAASISGMDSGGSGGYLGFATTSNGGGTTGSPTERMRIDAAGNVGIGTSSPGTKLDILSATNTGVRVTDGTYTGIMYPSGLGGVAVGTTSNHPYIFISNNTERMRIAATGETIVKAALQETKTALAANDISLSLGNYFTKTISGATTLTVSNVPTTGTAVSFILDLTNGGSATITWWSGVKWAGGTAPTLTASGRDSIGFYTYDGGTTWSGLVLGKDLK